VVRDPREGSLQDSQDPGVHLAGQRVVGIAHKDQDVQRTRVVAHADALGGSVLCVVEPPDHRQAAGGDPEALPQNQLHQLPLEVPVGQVAQQHRDAANHEQAQPAGRGPQGQQEAIAGQQAQQPDDPQAPVEVALPLAEIPGQEIPFAGRRGGCHEPLGHVVLQDQAQSGGYQVAALLHPDVQAVLDGRREQHLRAIALVLVLAVGIGVAIGIGVAFCILILKSLAQSVALFTSPPPAGDGQLLGYPGEEQLKDLQVAALQPDEGYPHQDGQDDYLNQHGCGKSAVLRS